MAIKTPLFFLCIDNEAYPASLDARKIYVGLHDADAEKHGMVRVIDESGEDYLYPEEMFVPIRLPGEAKRAFAMPHSNGRSGRTK